MASTPSLDQIVKGAPPPNISVNQVAASPSHSASDRLSSLKPRPYLPHALSDPTSLLPSSPPQIYLNLLILEASLRAQFLTLRARRRQNTFVLTLLAIWLAFFTYALWLRPRDDGTGIGGSQYWLVDAGQKLSFITGLVFVILFWATGQWERGVRWPRRWIGVTNRGLRGFNCKIVIMRGPWWKEFWGWVMFVVPFSGGLWGGGGDEQAGSSYHFVSLAAERKEGLAAEQVGGKGRHHRIVRDDGRVVEFAEEDVAPGGDYVKLLLLPKPFSPDFRENWEVYRTEFWERENERRRELRKKVRQRQKEIAREEGGWLWWTGWRGWPWKKSKRRAEMERMGTLHQHSASGTVHLRDRSRRPSSNLLKERGREGSMSHSRSSSCSTTPTPDIDLSERNTSSLAARERRWSTSTAGSTATHTSNRPRKKPSTTSVSNVVPSSRPSPRHTATNSSTVSRPGTPLSGNKRPSGLRTEERIEGDDVFPNAPSA